MFDDIKDIYFHVFLFCFIFYDMYCIVYAVWKVVCCKGCKLQIAAAATLLDYLIIYRYTHLWILLLKQH